MKASWWYIGTRACSWPECWLPGCVIRTGSRSLCSVACQPYYLLMGFAAVCSFICHDKVLC